MPRVYTKPIKEKFGELRGITGATMEDGTVYRSSRSGSMMVESADHIAAMKRDPRVADNVVVENYVPYSPEGGRHCPKCGFSAWSWQTKCPKDGTETLEWSE